MFECQWHTLNLSNGVGDQKLYQFLVLQQIANLDYVP